MTTPPQNETGFGSSTSSTSSGSAQDPGGPESEQSRSKRMADEAKTRTKAEVDRARDSAAHKADTLAESARAAADALGRDDIGHMSEYVSKLADGMSRFADGLRHKSGDEIARDVGRMARENQALFVAGSVAIGFGLSRFARASQHRSHAMVPADEARPGAGFAQEHTPTGESTVYSTGSLDTSSAAGIDSRDKGGIH